MNRAEISPLGDAAVLVQVGLALEPATIERVWSAYAAIRATLGQHVRDVVPAYGSVTVYFDPASTTLATIMASVRGALEHARVAPPPRARSFAVGVSFAPDVALDLAMVAQEAGLTQQALVELFCAADYRVAFLGFTAGFPYLLGLPQRLTVSRLASPRQRVPAGSVGIAAGQCGIYPRETPGGWKILGRTASPIFDPSRSEPALFRPGDVLRFFPAASLAAAIVAQKGPASKA